MTNLHITEDKKDHRLLLLLSGVLSLVFAGSYVLTTPPPVPVEPTELAALPTPFDNLDIVAKAAYVYDVRAGKVLYMKDENKRLPLASLTKVMAALVAEEMSPAGSTVVISSESLAASGDSGLRPGERWSLKELLDFTLTSSSNDGMVAVAHALGAIEKSSATPEEREADFVSRMNKKAAELGMLNTYFWNVTGLDESDERGGAYGTARDMAVLFDYVMRHHPELLDATRNDTVSVSSLDHSVYVATNTDQIVTELPGIKASKTGFTSIAGGNLVIAFDPELGRPVIVSVLGSTFDDRFRDTLDLVGATIAHMQGVREEALVAGERTE